MPEENNNGDPLPALYLLLWCGLFVYFAIVEWPPSAGFWFGWGGAVIGHFLWISELEI